MAEVNFRTADIWASDEPVSTYEYDQNAVRVNTAEPAPVQTPVTAPRELPRVLPDARPERAPKRHISFLYVAALVIGVILFSNIISMHGELTALSIKTHQLKTEITAMGKEQSALQLELNRVMNQNEIEEYAVANLGMVKATGESISYLNYQNETVFEIAEETDNGIFGTIFSGIKSAAQTVWSFIN